MSLTVRPLGYALGARVTGKDLRRPLSAGDAGEVRRACSEHVVLCFPEQNLNEDELLAFAMMFGQIDDNRRIPHLRHPRLAGILPLMSKAARIQEKGYVARAAGTWHSDLSFTDRPTTLTFLLAKELPESGGDTMFANLTKAYDALSPALQALLEPLSAVHDFTLGGTFQRASPEEKVELLRLNPPIAHRIVRVHPETGRKSLYLGDRMRNIVGMTEEESRPLIDMLNGHGTRYEFIYRHRWNVNDLVVWDNRSTVHFAVGDHDPGQLRSMMRCSLVGPKTGIPMNDASLAGVAP